MMNFLEPSSTKSAEGDRVYHLQQPMSNTNDEEYQQQESEDPILPIYKILDNHPCSR